MHKPRGTIRLWQIYNPDNATEVVWRWLLETTKFTIYGDRIYSNRQNCTKAAINNTKNLNINVTRTVVSLRNNVDFIA